MATTNLGSDDFRKHIVDGINKAMLSAVEPIIQQNLKEIETRMRETLGQYLIAMIERNLVMTYYGDELRITLNQARKTSMKGDDHV